VEADACYRASAIATARARARGVSAPVLARHFKQIAAERKAAENLPSYTSPTSVGYHARTGRLLLLGLPETDLSARDVQTLVKAVGHARGVGEVDRCLRLSRSQTEAIGQLRRTLDASRSRCAHGERDMLQVLSDPDERLSAGIWEINRLLDEDPELDPDLLERLADLGRSADNLLANRSTRQWPIEAERPLMPRPGRGETASAEAHTRATGQLGGETCCSLLTHLDEALQGRSEHTAAAV
jgi:hypothetical protein